MLYRVFPWQPGSRPDPLAVPIAFQGGGRHDNPDRYAAVYAAREAVSAVAERIQAFRGQAIADGAFVRPDGRRLALAAVADNALPPLLDLDDPAILLRLGLRPSGVATGDRAATQALARGIFETGETGCSWWSTLEAGWTNVTLFSPRLAGLRLPVEDVVPLTTALPDVRLAAERLGVRLLRGV